MPQLNRTGRKASNKRKPKESLQDSPAISEIQQAINSAKASDSGKVPLRVNRNTIILVKPEHNKQEYINNYQERISRP
jgi:hypothetical protein